MKPFASRVRTRAAAIGRIAFMVVVAAASLLGDPRPGLAAGPLTFESSLTFGYRANDIVLDERAGFPFAYVSTDKGLSILNISNPTSPVLVKQVVSSNCNTSCTHGPVAKSQGLAKKGDFVYLAAGAAGMQVINVANPPNAFTVASAIAPTRGTIYHVAIHPTAPAAYVASYGGEVYVWEITNPAAPVLRQTLGVMMWGGGVCNTCVDRMFALNTNGTAYVTGVAAALDTLGKPHVAAVDWGYGGLYLWDATDPFHLTFLGTHRLKVSMYRVALDFERDAAYTLGAFWLNSGLITPPLSALQNPDGAAYCSSFGEGPVPAPASPAPPCSGGAVCVRCGHAKMTSPNGAALAGDGGGIGFSDEGFAFYVGGRGTGELAIVDLKQAAPNDVFGATPKVASIPVGNMGLQLAGGAGIVARNSVLYVAAGLLGVRVYSFPGLGSSAP